MNYSPVPVFRLALALARSLALALVLFLATAPGLAWSKGFAPAPGVGASLSAQWVQGARTSDEKGPDPGGTAPFSAPAPLFDEEETGADSDWHHPELLPAPMGHRGAWAWMPDDPPPHAAPGEVLKRPPRA